ncbi:hypothetical protein B0H17DRAFT_1202402 [Mycena rosella]|uniref:Uncharacterized protein n=1 Tax=Mycena rosella TaxID=1033263 RepID=A0AAD7GDH1_MYCRO|nr:hypothetical protein B0H17DRAFT_1202402 [Mycena rosella]
MSGNHGLHATLPADIFKRDHRVERGIYRTVTSTYDRSLCPIYPLQRAIRASIKPAGFFHERIRHFWLGGHLDEEGVHEVLSVCSGVYSVALVKDVGPSALPSPNRAAYTSIWSTLFGDIQAPDLNHPMFAHLTHLGLFDETIQFTAVIKRVLATCSRLAVLIDMPPDLSAPAEWLYVDDPRLGFVGVVFTYSDYANDWAIGTHGSLDFWACGRVGREEKTGEIKPTLSFSLHLLSGY